MITIGRFRSLAESYGATLERWPEDVREDARALLAISAEAREALAEQEDLDALLARAASSANARLCAASMGEAPDAALSRLRAGVAAQIAATQAQRNTRRGFFTLLSLFRDDWRSRFRGDGLALHGHGAPAARWVGLATGTGAVLAVGFWVGWMQTVGHPFDLLGALQQAPIGGISW